MTQQIKPESYLRKIVRRAIERRQKELKTPDVKLSDQPMGGFEIS